MLHPDIWNKEGQLAWWWHPAELQEGQPAATVGKIQEAGSQLGEKNQTFAGSVYKEVLDLQQARTIPLHLSK